jgi:hypothetical protein
MNDVGDRVAGLAADLLTLVSVTHEPADRWSPILLLHEEARQVYETEPGNDSASQRQHYTRR